ncbi:MAG: hypothetical protein ACREJ3_12870, partial [Polyangiaceae bacterium]
ATIVGVLDAVFGGKRMPMTGTRSMTLGDNVTVQDDAGALATIANESTTLTTIGAGAHVGNVWSVGPVVIGPGALVSGFITSASTVTPQPGATITGSVVPNPTLSLPVPDASFTFPSSNAGDIVLLPGQTQTLAPGAYGAVSVPAGATLTFSRGTYDFNSLDIEPLATVNLDQTNGPIAVYVQSSLTFRSSFKSIGGAATDVLVAYEGVDSVVLQASFVGTLVALNARIELASVAGGHNGGFIAEDIVVDPSTTVTLTPFTGGGMP